MNNDDKNILAGLIAGIGLGAGITVCLTKKDKIIKTVKDFKQRLEENPPDEREELLIEDSADIADEALIAEDVMTAECLDVDSLSETDALADVESEIDSSDNTAEISANAMDSTDYDVLKEKMLSEDIGETVTNETGENLKEDFAEKNHKLLIKQNRIMYGILACVGGMFLVALVSAILIVPHVLTILKDTEVTLARVEAELDQFSKIEKIIDDMSIMSKDLLEADIPGLITDTKVLVEDSGEGITDAVSKLDSIDINGLNEAIADLNKAANAMGKILNF